MRDGWQRRAQSSVFVSAADVMALLRHLAVLPSFDVKMFAKYFDGALDEIKESLLTWSNAEGEKTWEVFQDLDRF